MKHTIPIVILLSSAWLAGCAGCESRPVTPSGGQGGGCSAGASSGGSGGSLQTVDPCDLACENFVRMKCPQAEAVDGVTCADLCRQVPILTKTAPCAARAGSCESADECSAIPSNP